MADTGIFSNNTEVERKAGANSSATSTAEAYTNDYLTQVEAFINTVCGFNFSDRYASLNVDTKGILKEIASNLAAIYAISYDMSGFTSRTEAEDMMVNLRDRALNGLSLLRDKKKVKYVDTGAAES